MSGYKCNIILIIVLALIFSNQVLSQEISYRDSLSMNSSQEIIFKPVVNYSIGSYFMAVPHLGSVTGVSISPSLSVPLSPKLSVSGGITATRLYSAPWNSNSEWPMSGTFNELSVYGSAVYHFNPQLTLYGTGIKRLTEASPFSLPKSSYIIGSNYNFGSFSIGVSMQVSKWNNAYSPLPMNGSPGFYSPFEQRQGIFY
jgi:hypothetical protein